RRRRNPHRESVTRDPPGERLQAGRREQPPASASQYAEGSPLPILLARNTFLRVTNTTTGQGRGSRRRTHPDEELFLDILRTADRLTQAELRLLRENELTFSQYNVLRILRGARPTALQCSEIAARMIHRDSDI